MSKAPSPFPHVLIRASAGTGKTFQLSNRFLGLAAVEPLDEILATTFTRKAAGEILDRVLTRLAGAVCDPAELKKLCRHVEGSPLDGPLCRTMLRRLIDHLHRLRVSTLDSFFMQIARSFCLELEMPAEWQIADEAADEHLRQQAIRAVLSNEATSDVVRMMNLLTKGEAARSITEQITGLVKGLYHLYLESPPAAWTCIPRPKPLKAADLAAAIAALESMAPPGNRRVAACLVKDVTNCRAEDWETLLCQGIGKGIISGDGCYYGKPIDPDVQAIYEPLLAHARAVVLGQLADQTAATWGLLDRFHAAYTRLKIQSRRLRFEDITRKVSDAALAGRLAEIVYRLDGRVAHLLLDEFQDTSPVQWRVLAPFARQVVDRSDGGSFFCVGDVKQAIYAWRGGVAEIFDTLTDEIAGLDLRRLDESYRSSPVIIECVNQLFESLSANTVLQDKAPAAAARWAGRYIKHTTALRDLPGYCRMVVAPPAEDDQKQDDATLQFAASEIARLHAEAPGKGIGVLVRSNKAVGRLIYELRQQRVDASEEGGNPLTDSPAVQLILSLLAMVDHPGDSIAAYHVARSPLGPVLGLTDHQDEQSVLRLAETARKALLVDGYGPSIDRWAQALSPACDQRERSRLGQLVELAYRYEDQATTRADDFIALVQLEKVESPSSALVRVMTVHQAKGLQFDIVVLPELDRQISGQPPQLVCGRAAAAAPIEHVCRYVRDDLRPILPARLQQMFEVHHQRVIEESLSLLYVALTRPVHALHLIIAPGKTNEKKIPGTFAGVLRAGLAGGAAAAPGSVLYQRGDAAWHQRCPSARAVRPPSPQAMPPLQLAKPAGRAARGLDHRSPSGLEGGRKLNLSTVLRLDRSEAIQRGILLHAWFELIEWLDDALPSDEDLGRAARQQQLEHLAMPRLIAQFRAALADGPICSALRRSTYQQPLTAKEGCAIHMPTGIGNPCWKVYRERSFAVIDNGTILNGTFDRLVVLCDGDRPLAADVVDFKSDDVSGDEAVDLRVETYRPQLEAYRRAASALLSLPPDQISCRLLFVVPGVIRAV